MLSWQASRHYHLKLRFSTLKFLLDFLTLAPVARLIAGAAIRWWAGRSGWSSSWRSSNDQTAPDSIKWDCLLGTCKSFMHWTIINISSSLINWTLCNAVCNVFSSENCWPKQAFCFHWWVSPQYENCSHSEGISRMETQQRVRNYKYAQIFLGGLHQQEYMMVRWKSFQKSDRKSAMSVSGGVEANGGRTHSNWLIFPGGTHRGHISIAPPGCRNEWEKPCKTSRQWIL